LRRLTSLICCLLVLALGVAAAPSASFASGQADRKRPVPVAPVAPGDRVVALAQSLLGVPYRSGGASPQTGFDCSGLVQYVYGQLGMALPHYSGALWRLGQSVDADLLAPGDVVFFDQARHVGIYIGGGLFIHAPHTGARVRVDVVTASWYGATFDGARRLL
jgi:cell wall-associated NlpC family hydrolase